MKLYIKRGNKNYKERRLLKELEPVIEEMLSKDPSFKSKVLPATNYAELQKLHSKYVGVEPVDVEYVNEEDISSQKPEEEISSQKNEEEILENMAKKNNNIDAQEVDFEETIKEPVVESNSNPFIDPFNREEPIVRDYVMGNDSLSKDSGKPQDMRTVFEEPTSFEEAFVIPNDDNDDSESNSEVNTNSSSSEKPSQPRNSPSSKEPLNPNFDEMSAGKKKKSAQKFAKYIVEAVSVISEKGMIWFSNKDINATKLTEYEMLGEVDLSLLVTLDTGQEVTVKQFFQTQCSKAEELSKWSDEQKEDLSTALAEVLLEKGIAPTPTQNLLLVGLTILGGQGIAMMTIKSQTDSLLNQLRSMNEIDDSPYDRGYNEPKEREAPVENSHPKEDVVIEDVLAKAKEEVVAETQLSEDIEVISEEEVLTSENVIETKE
jgi:hypothetical protein